MGILNLLDLFSGGVFSNIISYVTALIIVQLLMTTFPYFDLIENEGTKGLKKIVTITKYMTVALGLIQTIGLMV